MTGLTLHQLSKRNNYEIFLNKIKNGSSFELTAKKQKEFGINSVVILATEELIFALEKMIKEPQKICHLAKFVKNKTLFLQTTSGIKITSGALEKTSEFGGKTTEIVYNKEEKHHKNIQTALKKITVFGLRPITLHVRCTSGQRFEYKSIYSVTIPEFKGEKGKVDFIFLDKDRNKSFSVSHKDGKKAKHFRQWSGIKSFYFHKEIFDFGEDLKKYIENNKENISKTKIITFGRDIIDENLKKMAIFGNDEVDFLIQGNCEFIKLSDIEFELVAPLIIHKSESISLLPEEYQPILIGILGNTWRNAFGIKGCRGMIYPKSGRKIHKYI